LESFRLEKVYDLGEENVMKQVAILTDFTSLDPSYSLCIVAADQTKMLLRNGYGPLFIACEGFQPAGPIQPDEVRLAHIPNYTRSNYIELDSTFQDDVARLTSKLKELLVGVDIVLTHDLIYQPAALKLNFAARNIADEQPQLHWLHWVHSATPPAVLSSSIGYLDKVKTKFPNSMVVYPNNYELPRIARNFGYEIDEVTSVYHPIDVCGYLGFQSITSELVDAHRILEADAIGVYPIRLDRGKQAEFCIRVFAQLKRRGCRVCLVIVDFHSTGGDKVVYRKDLKQLGVDQGLNESELIFTSEFDKSLELECPREMVRDLMLLCNVYIHPSVSETYSLTTQEAALCGAFLVLNSDFPATRSVYGPDALYTGFSSGTHTVGYFWEKDTKRTYGAVADQPGVGLIPQKMTGVDAFAYDIAGRIAYELSHNLVLAQQRKIRQTRNLDYIFKHQLEPLFYRWD